MPLVVRTWWELLRSRPAGSTAMAAIPILPSGDLAVTEAFYTGLGFEVAGRYEGYLLMHEGQVEVHFSQPDVPAEPPASGTCFVHVRDAIAYWARRSRGGAAGPGGADGTGDGMNAG